MVSVKVQCGCGQRYAFDVEPVNGHMPAPVACPACGVDGTAAANEVIAQSLSAEPPPAPAPGIRLRTAAAPPATPPPLPASAAVAPRAPIQRVAPKGKDGWDKEESGLNKAGTYLGMGVAGLAALLSWGVFGLQVPTMILCVVVAIFGLVGGALNVFGRGPIAAGAVVGMVMALGGYAAAFWWIKDRKSVMGVEVTIAFIVGALPGFALQYGVQKWLQKRAGDGQ
ncbi:MAG: Pyrrolo-quinoline quinone [Pedosphaera sp.]|nr:Pyrrolo-quinoline quinone [Pedosphaera sp.]